MADLPWNDETIAIEEDLRQKFTYGGLTETGWMEKYGIVPTNLQIKAEELLRKFEDDTTNTLDELSTRLGLHAAYQIKHGLNRCYELLGWDDDSGWLAESQPVGREHLDWSDHKGKYQRYGYYWNHQGNPDAIPITDVASFILAFEYGGTTYADWYHVGVIPEQILPTLMYILNYQIDHNGQNIRFHQYLAGDVNQDKLNEIMTTIYDRNNGSLAKEFTDLYDVYRARDMTDEKMQELLLADPSGNQLPRLPLIMLEGDVFVLDTEGQIANDKNPELMDDRHAEDLANGEPNDNDPNYVDPNLEEMPELGLPPEDDTGSTDGDANLEDMPSLPVTDPMNPGSVSTPNTDVQPDVDTTNPLEEVTNGNADLGNEYGAPKPPEGAVNGQARDVSDEGDNSGTNTEGEQSQSQDQDGANTEETVGSVVNTGGEGANNSSSSKKEKKGIGPVLLVGGIVAALLIFGNK